MNLDTTGHCRYVMVGASAAFTDRIVLRWLTRVANAPEAGERIRIVLHPCDSGESIRAVRSGILDLGLIETTGRTPGLRSRLMTRDRLVVVVGPSHQWCRRASIDAATLSTASLIVVSSATETNRYVERALRHRLGPRQVPAQAGAEVLTSTQARAAARAGHAPAVLSLQVVADDLQRGLLRAVPISDVDLTRGLRAVWRPGNPPPAPLLSTLTAAATLRSPL